jgi:hypothetical protein
VSSRPMPEPPPVTTASLPIKCFMGPLSEVGASRAAPLSADVSLFF